MNRVVAMLLAVLLGSACASLDVPTPMPELVSITSPDPDIPPHVAAFSGVWTGEWYGTNGAQQSLVVTSIESLGNDRYFARVISGWAGGWRGRREGQSTLSGLISLDGVLRVTLGNGVMTYVLSRDRQSLTSEFKNLLGPGSAPQQGALRRTGHFQVK